MFGVGVPEVLVALVFVGVVTLVWLTTDPWISASQTLVVNGVTAAALEKPIHGLLGRTKGAQLTYTGTGTFVLVVRRIPAWTFLVVLLTLPFGLLLLFLVRRSEALLVTLSDTGSGTTIRVIGHTRQSVIKTLAKGLGSLRTPVNVR